MSDMLSLPQAFPIKRKRHAAKRRSGTAAVNAMPQTRQDSETDCGLGRVTGAAKEVGWTVGGGTGTSIVGASRTVELFLAPVTITAAALANAGNQVMVLSDGTAITSMDVARLIAR